MSKVSQPGHAKGRISIQASLCLAVFLLSLQPVCGSNLRAPAAPLPVQKVTVVGILPFQDETDSGAPAELGKKIGQQLKQRLSLSFKDVLPKSLNSDAATPLNVEQLVALGKQNAVQFVIRGGILTLAAADSNVTAQLYAEIISVESGGSSVVRAEGTAAGGSIQWSAIDLNSASFSSSAPGKALAAAIDQLATSVHDALLSPVAEASPTEVSPAETSTDSGETAESTPPVDAAAADADEELQQLIAQAEEVVANGTGDANSLQSVSSGLQKVKAALTSKASLIQGGGDPTRGDQEVAAAKSELQSALTSLNEQAAASNTSSEEVTEPTGEKKSLLGAIDERASEALGILQKIQEMRAAFSGMKGDANGGESGEGAVEGSEQATEDVSGVVMESGQPLAGVEVVDKDSNVTAITAPDGSYTLKSLKAGKISKLVLKKNGKQLAVGQVHLLSGRPAVADFEIKKNTVPANSAMRIIPSTAVLKRNSKAGATGTLKGTARDQAGKPLPRALVSIKGLAVARTDSQGRYAFLNVPAGEHLVTIQKPGSRPVSTRVSVKANVATESQNQLASVPRVGKQRPSVRTTSSSSPKSGAVNPIVVSRDRALGNNATTRDPQRVTGSSTQPRLGSLRGQVFDASNRRPIAGATVVIGTRHSKTDQAGNYEFADLAAGSYQAKVSGNGFSEAQESISIRAGAASREDFGLKRSADSSRTVRVPTEAPRVITQVRLGQVRGRVVDAATGVPIAGAVVAVSGQTRVITGRDGSYSLNALPAGSYQVSISRAGFAEKRTAFTIRASDVTNADVRLISTVRKPVR